MSEHALEVLAMVLSETRVDLKVTQRELRELRKVNEANKTNAEALDAELKEGLSAVGLEGELERWRKTVYDARRITECPSSRGLLDWLRLRLAEGEKVREALDAITCAVEVGQEALDTITCAVDVDQVDSPAKAVAADALELSGLHDTVQEARRITECPPAHGLVDWLQTRLADGAKVRDEVERLQADAEARRAVYQKLRSLLGCRADGPSILGAVESVKERCADLNRHAELLKADIDDRNVRIGQLERDLARAVEQREELRAANEGVKRDMQGLKDEVDRLTSANAARCEQASRAEERVREVEEEREEWRRRYAEAVHDLEERDAQLREVRVERDAARADMRRLEPRLDAMTRERDRLRCELAAAKEDG